MSKVRARSRLLHIHDRNKYRWLNLVNQAVKKDNAERQNELNATYFAYGYKPSPLASG